MGMVQEVCIVAQFYHHHILFSDFIERVYKQICIYCILTYHIRFIYRMMRIGFSTLPPRC